MSRATSLQLDRRIIEIGRALFDRAADLSPEFTSPKWWQERLMQWSMGQPDLKVRLFRLVDVLPSLQTAGRFDRAAVLDHLRQYLRQIDPQSPATRPLLTRLVRLAAPLMGSARSLRGRFSAAMVLASVRNLARRFIAAETIAQAGQAALDLRHRQLAFTLDLLGEKVLSEREADAYADQYLRLLDELSAAAALWPGDELLDRADGGRPIPRINLSLKLSSLDSQFDPLAGSRGVDVVLGRFRPILRSARQRGAFIHVDMEHYEVRNLTLDLFERIALDREFADWRDLGIVVQAYLCDSAADLGRVISLARRRGTPLTVRLVKGAYWDYENVIAAQRGWPVPVFRHKHQTDANFERLTRTMLAAGDAIDPAIASHNVRSLAAALATAEQLGLPPGRIEAQMLYGMGEPIQAALVERQIRVRVYAPFGELLPGMAYLIRRLLENTANESFLRQSSFSSRDEDELLCDPVRGRNIEDLVLPPSPARGGMGRGDFRNTADTDFSKEDPRVAMHDAIQRTRAKLGYTCRPIIGGEPVSGEETIIRENPADPDEVVVRVELAGRAHADRAVAAAEAAQVAWRNRPVEQRAEILHRLAGLIEQNRMDLAALEVFEAAKQWREADADVSEAADYCRYYGDQAVEKMGLANCRRRDVPGEQNLYRYLPRGVALIVAPWNFPLAILAGMSTAALAAGNAVILKPSQFAMGIASSFSELAGQAGLPPGVLNYLPCRGSTVGNDLVAHPGVDVIAFTGSRQVGLSIYARAAAAVGRRGPKRVVCEMGGKNAILIDDDADLDEAVRGVIVSAFGYNGQKCSACSRAIVVGSAYPRFLDRLVEAASSIAIGPPADPANFMGPVIDRQAFEQIREYIAVGLSEARCVLAGDVEREKGYYIGPTIFADVPPKARIAQEEIFGPVLSVMQAADFEEAIRLANDVDFALTGGVYSRSPAHIDQARRDFRAGNLYINRKVTGALVDRQPFGGFKFSGLGSKAGGPDYLLEFLLPQTVTENTLRHGFAPPE